MEFWKGGCGKIQNKEIVSKGYFQSAYILLTTFTCLFLKLLKVVIENKKNSFAHQLFIVRTM